MVGWAWRGVGCLDFLLLLLLMMTDEVCGISIDINISRADISLLACKADSLLGLSCDEMRFGLVFHSATIVPPRCSVIQEDGSR